MCIRDSFIALDKLISKRRSSIVILYIAIFYFLLHNLTNDLIYSPDAIILFMIILGLKDSITHLKDFENR